MKKVIISALMVSAFYSQAGSLLPYLAPDCKVAIGQPKTSGGYFRNKECDSALVLLPNESPIEVRAIAPTMYMHRCASLKLLEERVALQNQRLLDLQKKFNLATSDLEREKIQKEITQLEEIIKKPILGYDLVGATMQVVLNPNPGEDILAYLEKNQSILRDVTFVPAPITKAMLSFAKPNESGGNPILDIQIPGAVRDGDTTTILGIGAKSGMITFSLGGACPIVGYPSPDSDLSKLKVDPANVVMAANYTYSVPVMISKGYTARLDMRSFLNSLISNTKLKEQFQIREFYDKVVNASGNSIFSFQMHDESAATSDPKYVFELRDAVFLRLAGSLMDQLDRAGVIVHADVKQIAEPPSGSYVSRRIGTIHKCESHSFLGVNYNQSCWDEPWMISSWVNGVASVESRNLINLNYVAEEVVGDETRQDQAFTSAMVMKPASN